MPVALAIRLYNFSNLSYSSIGTLMIFFLRSTIILTFGYHTLTLIVIFLGSNGSNTSSSFLYYTVKLRSAPKSKCSKVRSPAS